MMRKPVTVETTRGTLAMIIAAVLAGLAVNGVFLLRAVQTAKADTRLCNVLRSLIAQGAAGLGKPGDPPRSGSPGYFYYLEHPTELETARANAQRNLAKLDCDNLPSAAG